MFERSAVLKAPVVLCAVLGFVISATPGAEATVAGSGVAKIHFYTRWNSLELPTKQALADGPSITLSSAIDGRPLWYRMGQDVTVPLRIKIQNYEKCAPPGTINPPHLPPQLEIESYVGQPTSGGIVDRLHSPGGDAGEIYPVPSDEFSAQYEFHADRDSELSKPIPNPGKAMIVVGASCYTSTQGMSSGVVSNSITTDWHSPCETWDEPIPVHFAGVPVSGSSYDSLNKFKKIFFHNYRYDALDLTFTRVAPDQAQCTFESIRESLRVLMDTSLGTIVFATSTTAARISLITYGPSSNIPRCDFVKVSNGCFVGSPPPQGAIVDVIRWSTGGFEYRPSDICDLIGEKISVGKKICKAVGIHTDPLAFFVWPDALSESDTQPTWPSRLQAAERLVHNTLISHLPPLPFS